MEKDLISVIIPVYNNENYFDYGYPIYYYKN